ncbi:MAG: metallophosphoesterase [Clostridia bacterium]|nr:metallophosphoesterase [Clostridia bacterium]
MLYLYILVSIAILLLIYMRIETTLLEVTRVSFTQNKDSLKVMQLSDIHINRLFVTPERIKQVIEAEKPDIILMTGDYIEYKRHIPKFLKFLNRLGPNQNFYLCLGNHDYEAFKADPKGLQQYIELIEATGVNILHNRSTCFEKNFKLYNIVGIADMRYKLHRIDEALQGCNPDALMNIGFSHNPDIVLEVPQQKLDYLFCGHFHGGQIWAPFDFEFRLLRREKLCKKGIKSGLHKVNGVNLYINRGLGNVSLPLRFLSRPEITIFQLP